MECTDLREKAGPQGDIIPIISSELGLYFIFKMSYISISPSHLTVCLEYSSLNSLCLETCIIIFHHFHIIAFSLLLSFQVFLAVHNSSIGHLVPWSVCLLPLTIRHYRVTLETSDL